MLQIARRLSAEAAFSVSDHPSFSKTSLVLATILGKRLSVLSKTHPFRVCIVHVSYAPYSTLLLVGKLNSYVQHFLDVLDFSSYSTYSHGSFKVFP